MTTSGKRRLSAGLLAAVLAVSTAVPALAAEPGRRQEDLDFLYENLKTYHPDMFANTEESVFLARKAEIEKDLDGKSDATFILDLQSLTSLIGDSHTQLPIGSIAENARFFPLSIAWMDGVWYLNGVETSNKALLGSQVTAINGHSMDDVLSAFSKLISADNAVKLRRQFSQAMNVAELYDYTGLIPLGEAMVLTLSSGKTLEVKPVPKSALKALDLSTLFQQRAAKTVTDTQVKYYWSTPLGNDLYYIQYNICREDEDLPMETFAAQVKTALDAGSYDRIAVDLRSNGGGSDGVIFPLLEVLMDEIAQGTEVVGLIGETTFSSAIINAVELREIGGVLVGEPTSGSVDHFGALDQFTLPNSQLPVYVSSKFISMSDFFDAAAGLGVEPLTPDVAAPQTMNDYLAGKDSAVEYLLAHPDRLSQTARPDAPMTRGRFLNLLYQAAGSPAQTVTEAPFQDFLGIESYLPAAQWAKTAGIAKGTAAGLLQGTRPLTLRDAAVFLIRYADAQKLIPAGSGSEVSRAAALGLLSAADDLTATLTRAQGAAFLAKLVK